MMKITPLSLLSFLLVTLIAAPGCDVTDSEPDPTRVRVQMQSSESIVPVAADSTGNQIVQVKLYIGSMALESDADSIGLERNNFIVNLPLNGAPLGVSDQEIADGTYPEFDLAVEKPDEDDVLFDPDFWDETGNYSVVVKGFHMGEPFLFRSRSDFDLSIGLVPPFDLAVSEYSALVVNIDVAGWFTGPGGETLDPADISNGGQIDDNIETSFGAFKREQEEEE